MAMFSSASLSRTQVEATPTFSPPPNSTPSHHNNSTEDHRGVRFASTPVPSFPLPEYQEDASWYNQGHSTVMALTAAKGKIGGVVYFGSEGERSWSGREGERVGSMGLLGDLEDGSGGEWDVARMVLEQVQPSVVLTSGSADSIFLSSLETILQSLPKPFKIHKLPSSRSSNDDEEDEEEGNEDDKPTRLEYRSSREFNVRAGKSSLARLRVLDDEELNGEDGDRGEGERETRWGELRLESFVNGLVEGGMDLTLGSAYCLISHLSRIASDNAPSRMQLIKEEDELDDQNGYGYDQWNEEGGETRVVVQCLQWLKLEKVMQVSTETLSALQIFSSEAHASTHSSQKKEGLSLFGILSITHSPLGYHRLRQWFLRPSLEIPLILSRQSAIECFLRGENQHPAKSIQKNMNMIKNVPMTLKKMKKGKGLLRDWKSIWTFIYALMMIRESAMNLTHTKHVEVIQDFLRSFDDEALKDFGGTINDVIDWEESLQQKGRIVVMRNIDESLDGMRRTYEGLPSLLTKIATDIANDTEDTIAASLNVVYFPQMGFLITVPREGDDEEFEEEKYEDVGWKYQFATEQSVYFKNQKCLDLDYHLGDVSTCIQEKEIEILHVLLETLLTFEEQICAACDRLADLDCLLAFADAARIYDWTKPGITEEPICRILRGRHPLVELSVESFVKNDISLVGGRGAGRPDSEDEKPSVGEMIDPNLSMLIITGANYSGKSIMLKQTALITFLAHLGSFVPAESSIIGLTDRILTRISTRESITRGSSAFMIDLQQISFMLRNATAHSLLLIDEFGKGTDTNDGAGLDCGVIENIIKRGYEAPRTVVATHFQHVIMNGLLSPNLPIGIAHMQILVDDKSTSSSTSASTNNHVTYLYKLSAGLASSHAAACASLFGIDDSIVARASYVTDLLSKFEIDKLQQEELDDDALQELEDCEEVARKFLQWHLNDAAGMTSQDLIETIKAILSNDGGDVEM